MGESSRRKTLGLGFKKIDANSVLAAQAQIYKKTEQLRPDLGMTLALLDYSQPLTIGCFHPMSTRDIVWDFSISGVLECYESIVNNMMPTLPLLFDSYFFTIALKNGDRLSKFEVMDRLQSFSMVVRIEPKYKYLVPSKKEWVLPLVPVNHL